MDIIITAGRYRGRCGWISGSIEDRRGRGITKTIVKFDDGTKPELLSLRSIATAEVVRQFDFLVDNSCSRIASAS